MPLVWFLAACSSRSSDTDTDTGSDGSTSVTTNGDPCDAVGDPAVLLGTLSDAGDFAPWDGDATFAIGATAPTATGPSETLSIGLVAVNLEIDDFTYVDLVATDGSTQLFESSIPAGFACDAVNGPVGLVRVDFDWSSVAGRSVAFTASITDVTGRTGTGSGTVTIDAPP